MPLDENSVLLVSDRRTVKRFDLDAGSDFLGLPGERANCRSTGRRDFWAMPNACWCCTTATC